MRRFVVVARDVGEVEEYLPVVSRCVSASIMLSHRLREDSDFLVVLERERVEVFFNTAKLRNVRPDESSLRGVLVKALRRVKVGVERWHRVHSGVIVSRRGIEYYISSFKRSYYCSTRGVDILTALRNVRGDVLVVLPLTSYSAAMLKLLSSLKASPIRCPLSSLWPDQVIVVINVILDRVMIR